MKLLVILLFVILTIRRSESRNQGCSLLMLVDETVQLNEDRDLKQKLDQYVDKLNNIYQNSILQDPPNDNVYFFIKHVIRLTNFLKDCRNKQVEISFFKCILILTVMFPGASWLCDQGRLHWPVLSQPPAPQPWCGVHWRIWKSEWSVQVLLASDWLTLIILFSDWLQEEQ